MSTTWILIMVLWAHSGTTSLHVEFSTERACKSAIEEINKTTVQHVVEMICVPRYK